MVIDLPSAPQLQDNVLTEFAARATSTAFAPCFKCKRLAGPEFVITTTRRPSGFAKPTWSTPSTFPIDQTLFAPRRTWGEKCEKAQSCPLRVMSWVSE